MTEQTTPATDAKQTKAAKTAKAKTITVLGPPQGRRRAGRRFGPEAVEIPVSELTAAAIKQLKSDPLLSVSES